MKDKEFRPLLDEEWKKIKAVSSDSFNDDDSSEINWNYYISEPFPSIWPPDADLFLIYYAYGEGFGLSSSFQDGLFVSAPWARIDFDYINNPAKNKWYLRREI